MTENTEVQAKLDVIAGELIMLDVDSPAGEWSDFATAVDELAALAGEGSPVSGAAEMVSGLAKKIAGGKDPDPADAVEKINLIVEALQSDGGDGGLIKDSLARANIHIHNTESKQDAEPTAAGIQQEFIFEIHNRIDAMEALLFGIEPGERNPETVRSVFREIHTLKGEAGVVGLMELSSFFHRIESAIEEARHGRFILTAEVLDCLQELIGHGRHILNSNGDGVDNQNVIDAAHERLERVAEYARTDEATEDEFDSDEIATEELLFPGEDGEGSLPESPSAVCAEIEETSVTSGEMHAVSVQVKQLDRLLELVGEVSLLGGSLGVRDDIRNLPGVELQLQELTRACKAMQATGAEMRMSPIRPLFQMVQRAALEAARTIGKRIEVRISGADTLVDRTVIERLSAALIHLARNAVDHGLEPAEERRKLGKPERGIITLRATRSENDVMLDFSDDGYGLNLEKIREKAQAIGLVAAGAELSDAEISNLIFRQGLSTSKNVNSISGRGVGMSVVRESVEALRGRAEVSSVSGKGTTFRLRMPVALTAVEGLLVRLGKTTLVLPISAVRENFKADSGRISTVEGRGTVVSIRGVIIPVLNLSEAVGLPGDFEKPEDGVLVIVEEGDSLCAILVDEVLESRQIMIRPLEGSLSKVPSVSGAALLADRQVALVLEPRLLLKDTFVASGMALAEAGSKQIASERAVETVAIGSNQVSMIDFSVRGVDATGNELDYLFAINAFKVREFVIPERPLTSVPGAPHGFAGMLMLRGSTIPVVSLTALLGLAPGDGRNPDWESTVVVGEFAGHVVGFFARSVNRVSYVSWNDIMPPPETGAGRANCAVGTILLSRLRDQSDGGAAAGKSVGEDPVVMVLDFERIVQQAISLYDHLELGDMSKRQSGNRILLVEDSSLIRSQTRAALERAGLEVIEAANGEEARGMLTTLLEEAAAAGRSIFSHIDLVLSDIEMPRLDGYSLTSWIKSHNDLRVLPVILYSSITNETVINRAGEVRADGFVSKYDRESLCEKLRKFL